MRVGPPILGRGYMEAVTDAEIERLAAEQATRTDGIHGQVNRVTYASEMSADPRFHQQRRLPFHSLRIFVPLLVRSRVPVNVLRLLQSPAKARARTLRQIEEATRIDLPAHATASERLDLFAKIDHRPFPGGRALRTPLLVAAMAWYKLRDALW